jgi:hypothetical protein
MNYESALEILQKEKYRVSSVVLVGMKGEDVIEELHVDYSPLLFDELICKLGELLGEGFSYVRYSNYGYVSIVKI